MNSEKKKKIGAAVAVTFAVLAASASYAVDYMFGEHKMSSKEEQIANELNRIALKDTGVNPSVRIQCGFNPIEEAVLKKFDSDKTGYVPYVEGVAVSNTAHLAEEACDEYLEGNPYYLLVGLQSLGRAGFGIDFTDPCMNVFTNYMSETLFDDRYGTTEEAIKRTFEDWELTLRDDSGCSLSFEELVSSPAA